VRLYNRLVSPLSRTILAILMAGLLVLALLGRDPGEDGAGGVPTCCAEAQLTNAWCEADDRGFVAGLEIRSRELHDALDAHGHEVDRDSIQCETCRTLMDAGGFCETCRIGWVAGQAYFTRLTYHLAQGRPTSGADGRCEACRDDARLSGWCSAGQHGWAGNVVFGRREDQEAAARELDHLLVVIETSERCATCSLVQLVGDGRCPYCQITYAGGVPVER
jgi:hypothetical protein